MDVCSRLGGGVSASGGGVSAPGGLNFFLIFLHMVNERPVRILLECILVNVLNIFTALVPSFP